MRLILWDAKIFWRMMNNYMIFIDRQVCWNSNRQLLFIVCRPRKTNVHLRQTNGSLPSLFTICRKKIYIYAHTHSETVAYICIQYICYIWNYTIHINVYIYIYIYTCGCFKQKPEAQAIFFNLFAHHSNGSLSFVCLLMKKQMEVIRLQRD
jgi:hypothetical protein